MVHFLLIYLAYSIKTMYFCRIYSIKHDIETRTREMNALLQLAKRTELRNMLIITKDEEFTISVNGINIEVVPAWKWLLME